MSDEFREVFNAVRADKARRHKTAEPSDLALEAPLVGSRYASLHDHARSELGPIFNADSPIGERQFIETIVLVTAPNGKLKSVANGGNRFKTSQFEGPLLASTEIHKCSIRPNADNGARNLPPGFDRMFRLKRFTTLQQFIDR